MEDRLAIGEWILSGGESDAGDEAVAEQPDMPEGDAGVSEVEVAAPRQPPQVTPLVNSAGHKAICETVLPQLFKVMLEPLWSTRTPREQVRETLDRAQAVS